MRSDVSEPSATPGASPAGPIRWQKRLRGPSFQLASLRQSVAQTTLDQTHRWRLRVHAWPCAEDRARDLGRLESTTQLRRHNTHETSVDAECGRRGGRIRIASSQPSGDECVSLGYVCCRSGDAYLGWMTVQLMDS